MEQTLYFIVAALGVTLFFLKLMPKNKDNTPPRYVVTHDPLNNIPESHLKTLYQAALNAIAHVNGNAEGFYPKECDCDSCERKRICEAVAMLNDTYDELTK